MSTTINAYSVSLGLNASDYIKNSSLSRAETNHLKRSIESARDPMENLAIEQSKLDKALKAGAIDQNVYNRLLDSKSKKLGIVASSFNPYTAALTAAAAGATAAAASGVVFVKYLRDVQAELDSTAKAATKLGMSFNEVSSLRFAAAEIGGSDAATVDTAMRKLQINAAKALEGDDTLKQAFARLGIDAATVLDKGPVEAVKRIADAFEGVNSQAERLKLAAELFGKSGVDLVDTLQAGRSVIEESAGFQEKWNSLTDAQIMGVESANDAWGRIFHIIDGITNVTAAEFAPAFQLVADTILESADGIDNMQVGIRGVVDTTVYLAGTFKDVLELAIAAEETYRAIQTLDFSNVRASFDDALDFSSGQKALDALHNKRLELQNNAFQKEKQRELERQKLVLEGVEEEEKAKTDAFDKLEKSSMFDFPQAIGRSLYKFASNALDTAAKQFEDEMKRQKKIEDDVVSLMSGASMQVGSAESVRFQAQQQIREMARNLHSPQNKPLEDGKVLEVPKRQLALAEKADARDSRIERVLTETLQTQRENGFRRIR